MIFSICVDVIRPNPSKNIQFFSHIFNHICIFRWSFIAARLPGRTANGVKNYWNTHLLKKVVSKKEEKEKEKPKETMKSHEVIKPRPISFSTQSSWLNVEHNNFVTQPILASNNDGSFPRDRDDKKTNNGGTISFPSFPKETMMVPNQIGKYYASSSQPSLGNVPIPCTMWSDSLWNLGEQVDSEIIGSCSSLQVENYKEFSIVDDSFWDFNLCDFDSLWDP